MLTIVSDRWTELLHDGEWWRRAWAASWQFAPRCIIPSAVLTAANVIVVLGSAYLPFRLKQMQNGVITDLTPLLVLYLMTLAGTILILVLSMWALAQWLLELTTFARLFWESENARVQAPDADAAHPLHALEAVEKAVKARWTYVMRVWLIASLFLIPPALPLAVLIGVRSMLSTTLIDVKMLGWPAALSTPAAEMMTLAAGAVLTVVCTAYTFVTIVFSAISELPAAATATVALKETVKPPVPIFCITAIILLANVIVTAPQMIAFMTSLAAFAKHPAVEACAQIWLGVSSLVLWPLSVAPFCRLTRQAAENKHG